MVSSVETGINPLTGKANKESAILAEACRLFAERERVLTRDDLVTIAEADIRASRVFAQAPPART